jgi:hypothetical protein
MSNHMDFRRFQSIGERIPIEPGLRDESNLHEMLKDPVLQALMIRDGVTRKYILGLMRAFKEKRLRMLDGDDRPAKRAARKRSVV